MARAASGAYACGFLGSEGRRTQFELALVKEEGVPGRGEARIMDVRLWSARARVSFWGWKDEKTWSYCSSRPESVPTCQPHWCSRKRTENAVRETH